MYSSCRDLPPHTSSVNNKNQGSGCLWVLSFITKKAWTFQGMTWLLKNPFKTWEKEMPKVGPHFSTPLSKLRKFEFRISLAKEGLPGNAIIPFLRCPLPSGWVRKSSNRILSQFVKPTPNTFYSLCPAQARAYSDLLSTTVIGLGFLDPLSSGLPFRLFKKQKSDACCRTCYHSNHFRKPRPTPLPVGWNFLRFFWYWVWLFYKHRWSSTRLRLLGYPSSINKQERKVFLSWRQKLDAFLKV